MKEEIIKEPDRLKIKYTRSRNYENITKERFEGAGKYDIPILTPTKYETCEFIGFNYHNSCKNRPEKGIHFFLDDYQFTRLWTHVDKYLLPLKQYRCVLTPDFSLYDDFPEALQIYNHYRKHWLGAYLQTHGIKVIPSIAWSSQHSFEWCFDGEPIGGTVAVSTVGTQKKMYTKEMFLLGYQEMIKRLKPETILIYGKIPKECKNTGNIVALPAFQEHFKSYK